MVSFVFCVLIVITFFLFNYVFMLLLHCCGPGFRSCFRQNVGVNYKALCPTDVHILEPGPACGLPGKAELSMKP